MLAEKNTTFNPLFTSHTVANLIEKVNATPARSAWAHGVKEYAVELLESYADGERPESVYLNAVNGCDLESELLNGADSWNQYSAGGCALIYDGDIAARLCTPSELKKTRGGELNPNATETWIDTQARALFQAAALIKRVFFF